MTCWQPWSKREDPDNEQLEPWDVDEPNFGADEPWETDEAIAEQERIADLEDPE